MRIQTDGRDIANPGIETRVVRICEVLTTASVLIWILIPASFALFVSFGDGNSWGAIAQRGHVAIEWYVAGESRSMNAVYGFPACEIGRPWCRWIDFKHDLSEMLPVVPRYDRAVGSRLVSFPLWMPILALALVLRKTARNSFLRDPRRCAACSYWLIGNVSGRCPDCGTIVPPAQPSNAHATAEKRAE